MAGAFRIGGFCGCCEGGGTPCGGTCAACGGIRVLAVKLTDSVGNSFVGAPVLDGGGNVLYWQSGFALSGFMPANTVLNYDGVTCAYITSRIQYQYRVQCLEGGDLGVSLYATALIQCTDPNPPYTQRCGYDGYAITNMGAGAIASDTQTPDCGGTVTATFSFASGSVDCLGYRYVDPPVSSVDVEIEFDTGGNDPCCYPCRIPASDLTLSWDFSTTPAGWTGGATGSTTLTYNSGAGTWTTACLDGKYKWVLDCGNSSGTALRMRRLTYSGASCSGSVTTDTKSIYDITCSPYHAQFFYPSGTFVGSVYADV